MKLLPSLLLLINNFAGAHLVRQRSSLDLSQWDRSHEADAKQLLRVSIVLRIPNVDLGVETLLRISDPTSPEYGQHLSVGDVARMFRPESKAVSEVTEWLGESGIDKSHVKISHGGDRLSLTLSVQQTTQLLQTEFYHQTHQTTGKEQITCQDYRIPESLAESIDYILTSSPVLTHKHIARQQQIILDDKPTDLAPLPPRCLKQTTLSCLRTLYNIPEDVIPHPNNTFGIFEPAWISWLEEDLDEFFLRMQKNLYGQRPKVEAINGGYLQRNYTGPNWNQEPNLDFEYGMALTSPHQVTNVQVGSHDEVGNLNDMLAAFDEYYCDRRNSGNKNSPDYYPPGCNATACDCGKAAPPNVISISWGWTEAGFSPSYLQRQCLEFLKLGLMGTTVVVSVSDHGTTSGGGSFCIDDPSGNATAGKFSPTFPSTCPWVTSVGGTQMLQPDSPHMAAGSTNETTFRKVIAGHTASSGGGFSNVFRAPPYQIPNVATYKNIEKDHLEEISDRFSATGRGYPDFAARADDYIIVSNGNWKTVSGTSASNPVFASLVTLINSERMNAGKGPVGFINPVLYSNSRMLNDVVTGANSGCGVDQAFRAVKGWDAVTGLGSPDYERMRDVFISLP